MEFWKEHPVLRIVLIAVLFVLAMVLVVQGWQMTGQLAGLGVMVVGVALLLAALAGEFAGFQERLSEAEPIAAIIISDPLREDAAECIRFFQENEVDIKIILGDNPKTVSALARQAGGRGAKDCEGEAQLQSDEEIEEAILNHSVIGRAAAQQKHKMILT